MDPQKQKMAEMIENEVSNYKILEREQIDYEIQEINRKFESGDLARPLALTRHKWGITGTPVIRVTTTVHTLSQSSNAIRSEGIQEIANYVRSLMPEGYEVGSETDLGRVTTIKVTM